MIATSHSKDHELESAHIRFDDVPPAPSQTELPEDGDRSEAQASLVLDVKAKLKLLLSIIITILVVIIKIDVCLRNTKSDSLESELQGLLQEAISGAFVLSVCLGVSETIC